MSTYRASCAPRTGKLTAAKERRLPDKAYGLPKARKYPMPDASHARNAKSRASAEYKKGNLTRKQYAQIQRKANRIIKGCGGDPAPVKNPVPKLQWDWEWPLMGSHVPSNKHWSAWADLFGTAGLLHVSPVHDGWKVYWETTERFLQRVEGEGYVTIGRVKTVSEGKKMATKWYKKAMTPRSKNPEKKMKKNPKKKAKNPEHEVRELELYIDNEATLYRQRKVPIQQNLVKKKLAGKYDSAKSPKLWGYLVEAGAKKYARDHASSESEWNKIFSVQDRRTLAKRMAQQFEEEYRSGDLDHIVEEVAPVAYKRAGYSGEQIRKMAPLSKKPPKKKNPKRKVKKTRRKTKRKKPKVSVTVSRSVTVTQNPAAHNRVISAWLRGV